ncbi:organic cation transporter protein-like [Crassostrea angulata]|uniref:organic cation transporter protein-like n=1 Tax=Magallana angulata TaxID=2784310 RepID=UPI0022B16E26|nr:organic cation transporter protein-like [Crassostrea angulata]
MEYDEVIKKFGSFGNYQKRLYFVLFLPIIFNSFSSPVTNFLLGEQLHRCRVPGLPNDTFEIQNDYHKYLINLSIPLKADGDYEQCLVVKNGSLEKCTDWVYDRSMFTNTVNSQFNLVCDQKLMRSHAVMAYFIGTVVSTVVFLPLGDIVGRRYMVCISTSLTFIANIAMPFSTSVFMFSVCRFFDGFCGNCLYMASFIIAMEFVGPKHRIISGTCILLVYCLGEYILLLLGYFIRDWKWLQFTLAVPMVIPLIYWWPKVLPESPRWLISRQRYREALKILRYAAKVNKVELDESNCSNVNVGHDDGILKIIKELIRTPKLVIRSCIMLMNWFVISFIYYGLTINMGKLDGNLYVNFLVGVTVEGLGYLLCFVMNKTGRKPLHLTVMFGSGFGCLLSILPALFLDSSYTWLLVAFAMIGKFGISAAIGEIYIYTGELFPTVVRSFILGFCGVGARVGATLSPYIYHLADGRFGEALPLIIFGGSTIIVAALSIKLPETKGRKLLEKVKDAEHEDDISSDECEKEMFSTNEKLEYTSSESSQL